MTSPSRHLTPRQYRGLCKLGDVYCPGEGKFVSFSALGCGEHVDVVLDEMPTADRDDLKKLLHVASYAPMPLLRGLFAWLESSPNLPGELGVTARFLRLGVRGLVMTLYYSGRKGSGCDLPTPLEVLDYRVGVYTADLETSSSATAPANPDS